MRRMRFLCVPLAALLLAIPASGKAESLLEKIAMTILADRFGIDTSQVSMFQKQTNLSVYGMAPTYQASYYFDRDPATIRRLRDQGLGWGEIAQRVGMQPGEFNKLRQQGAFDQDRFWDNSYRNRFGASSQQVQTIRKGGANWEDVLGAILAGKLSKTDPQAIYSQYRDQRSWTTVTQKYNVDFSKWQRVSSPARAATPIRKWSKSKGDRDDDGNRGRGVGKGKSKGQGKSMMKGKSGQGHGKGHSMSGMKSKGKSGSMGKGMGKGPKGGGKGKG